MSINGGRQMRCFKCGTEFEEGFYCPECGTKYDEEKAIKAEAIRAEEEKKQREIELEKAKAEQERLAKERAEQEAELLRQKNESVRIQRKCEAEQREISEKKKLHNKALWCLILGLAVFPLIFTCILWLPALVFSIIFGCEAIKKNSSNKSCAIVGLVFDGIFVVFMILCLIISLKDDPVELTSPTKDYGTEADVSDNESERNVDAESDKEVKNMSTAQTTNNTKDKATTSTTPTTTNEEESLAEEYLEYLSWAGDYGGGWVDEVLELEFNDSAAPDGLCGYLKEYMRGSTAVYSLYYQGDGCFYGKFMGGSAPGDYQIYLKEDGEKTLEIYYEDGTYAVTFIKGAEMLDRSDALIESREISGTYKSEPKYIEKDNIRYYDWLEVYSNNDGTASYLVESRYCSTDARFGFRDSDTMVLQDDGSYESEECIFTFYDDGVFVEYKWDDESEYASYCYCYEGD